MERSGKGKRGFASMDPERRRELARRGGQAVHRLGTAHTFTSAEARLASQKRHREARLEWQSVLQTPGQPTSLVGTPRGTFILFMTRLAMKSRRVTLILHARFT